MIIEDDAPEKGRCPTSIKYSIIPQAQASTDVLLFFYFPERTSGAIYFNVPQ
jgi:hypothetical protein